MEWMTQVLKWIKGMDDAGIKVDEENGCVERNEGTGVNLENVIGIEGSIEIEHVEGVDMGGRL